jgi:transcriptional antiterminator RfaH
MPLDTLASVAQSLSPARTCVGLSMHAPCGSRRGGAPNIPRWHCAFTHPHEETRAHKALVLQGYDAFLPFVSALRSRGRRTIEPAFPGYLFVAWHPSAAWLPIVSTDGIAGVICHAPNCPTPMPDAELDALMARTSDRGVIDDLPEPHAVPLDRGRWHGLAGLTPADRIGLLARLFGERVALAA